jgi:hypothetical protein
VKNCIIQKHIPCPKIPTLEEIFPQRADQPLADNPILASGDEETVFPQY